MDKVLYFCRVFLISLEFLLILIGLIAYLRFGELVAGLSSTIRFNSEMVNWLALIPFSLFVWILNEIRSLLVGDKDHIRVLTVWSDYWRLRVHVFVNFIYSIIFLSLSVSPVLLGFWRVDAIYSLMIVVGYFGLFVSALSIYLASIRVKELIGRLRSP